MSSLARLTVNIVLSHLICLLEDIPVRYLIIAIELAVNLIAKVLYYFSLR